MIIHDVVQRSPEWFNLRVGVATASAFDRIVTPAKGELSKSADQYCNELLSGYFLGEDVNRIEVKTYWMERGALLEVEARQLYEFKYDVITTSVGFIMSDDGLFGASPDWLVGEDGMAECKCPAPHTHIENLISKDVDRSYWPQVQGQLLIAERQWSDWMSYHPEMPESIIRTQRDEPYLTKMQSALDQFKSLFNERKEALESIGMKRKQIVSQPKPDLTNILMAG